jgi:hypothetical protein
MLDLHGISRASFDLIVASEVTGETAYEKRYRGLQWPGEQSGPTGGIGYDFGQQSKAQITADWKGRVPDAMLKALLRCSGVTGAPAKALAQQLSAVVDIPWDVALDVFSSRDVPRYLAILRRACPGVEELPPDCQGALLSITFNRDASGFNSTAPRYAEMGQIRDCVKAGQLARIPGLIRSMKRLWPNSKGLRTRREDEAVLFEKGLAEHHPEIAAAAAAAPAPPDPDVVARVQRQLRDLGYYQVGAIDGSLTPHGRTEDAILAFRNRNGLPLTPTIDDDFLNALAKARPPEISEERAGATAKDLREQGSETIDFTDRVKSWAGRLFGGGTGITGAGLVAYVTDKATAISGARDAVAGLGLSPQVWLAIAVAVLLAVVVAGMGVGIWYVAHRLEQKRLADYRIGKNP